MAERNQEVAQAIRAVILFAASVSFVALATIAIIATWSAPPNEPPSIASVQSAALGGLALVLGGGFALLLGAAPPPTDPPKTLKSILGLDGADLNQRLLLAGAITYMVSSIAIAATYAIHQDRTPEVLQTISVAFAGYVVAYISAAYKDLAPPPPS